MEPTLDTPDTTETATAPLVPSPGPVAVLGGRRPTGTATGPAVDPEGIARRRRRSFPASERLRILTEIDAAVSSGTPGAVGVILRREGIYASHVSTWRRQRATDGLERKRGRKARAAEDLRAEIDALQRENKRLQARLHHAEQIIDLQKKVSNLLTILPSEMLATGGIL